MPRSGRGFSKFKRGAIRSLSLSQTYIRWREGQFFSGQAVSPPVYICAGILARTHHHRVMTYIHQIGHCRKPFQTVTPLVCGLLPELPHMQAVCRSGPRCLNWTVDPTREDVSVVMPKKSIRCKFPGTDKWFRCVHE